MARSRFYVHAELLCRVLNLPDDVRIVHAHWMYPSDMVDFEIEGPSVPDAVRVEAVVHQKEISVEFHAVVGSPVDEERHRLYRSAPEGR